MTPEQAMDALKDKAYVTRDRNELPPLMLSPRVPDIQSAIAVAKQAAEAQGEAAKASPKLEAARVLLSLVKSRRWKSIEHEFSTRQEKQGIRKIDVVVGTIEQYQDLGAHGRGVLIATKNKRQETVSIHQDLLDEDSVAYLKEVDKAVHSLAECLADETQADRRLIKIRAIEVRGITLNPEMQFEDGVVERVVLSTANADDPRTRSVDDFHGTHRTLCDALKEKYGLADEHNEIGSVDQVVWRFPNAVVRCCRCNHGVQIFYEKPGPNNASGHDNL